MRGRRLRGWLVEFAALLTLAGCVFPLSHDVTAPDKPSGLAVGLVGETLVFSVAGAACTRNHTLLYQWDWGNGNLSAWSLEAAASYAWERPGSYTVKARARCRKSGMVDSPWSEGLEVQVLPLPVPPS